MNMGFIKNKQAFTLIQLIVSLSIILILAAIVLFGEDAISRRGKAKDVRRSQDVMALGQAVELYQNDNNVLPPDLAAAINIGTNQKFVLCSAAINRTCDGQIRSCLVLDDKDFLNGYLKGSLPIDPEKTATTDTGYYIARNGDQMVFGACSSYSGGDIEYVARAKVPAQCGNSIIEDDEVCDDGDTVTEGCASGTLDTAGTHCNSTCTAVVTLGSTEPCDYGAWSNDCKYGGINYTTSDVGGPSYCNITCTVEQSWGITCESIGS